MKISLKQIAAGILTVFALFGAVWGINDQYTPREVTEMLIADLQKNQLQIQKNIKIQNAQQWEWFWQMKVDEYNLLYMNSRDPEVLIKLNEAKLKRDAWHQRVEELLE